MDKPKYPRFLGRTDTALEQERDGWSAAIVYLNEERARLQAENEQLRQLIKDMIEWNHLHGYPRGSEWEALEERALEALDDQPPQEDG